MRGVNKTWLGVILGTVEFRAPYLRNLKSGSPLLKMSHTISKKYDSKNVSIVVEGLNVFAGAAASFFAEMKCTMFRMA